MPERKQDRWARKARKEQERLQRKNSQGPGELQAISTSTMRTETQDSRLKFLVLLGLGGLAIGAGGVVIIKQVFDGSGVPIPSSILSSPVIPTYTSWERLTEVDKIQKLQAKNYPSLPGFDPDQELFLATANYYCANSICLGNPLEMAKRVSIVGSARILQEVEKVTGRPINDQEREKYVEDTVEMVTPDGSGILFHQVAIDRVVDNIKRDQRLMSQIGNLDLQTVIKTGLLFHSYSHYNSSSEELSISPIDLYDVDGKFTGTVNRFYRFTFEGKNTKGKTVFHIGANEALTEYHGAIIGENVGPNLSPEGYLSGARIVQGLNRRARLEDRVFKEIYSGKRSSRELLNYWGSLKNPNNPDHVAALQILIIISLRVKDVRSYMHNAALADIERVLRG